MVNQELSESVVELLTILDNTDEKIVRNIPQSFLDFLKSIKSDTYKFEYDATKSLMEQNLKPKTRGLIALIYQDYICNEEEKKEYIELCNDYLRKEEERKNEIYNKDIFRKVDGNKLEETKSEEALMLVNEKESFFTRIAKKIKNIFRRDK